MNLQEPKLSAARRIVVEWTDYDEEMQKLSQDIAKDRLELAEASTASDDKTKSKDEL